MPVPQCVQVQTAVGSKEEADALAEALLRPRLAACVQVVGPVQSRYWWHGELESAEEWLCLAKTTSAGAGAAMEALARAHSYETPEIIVTPIVHGSDPYLRWIGDQVRFDEPGAP
ncbi:MAG: divalent-cation tolerance protein CutA [Acidimicrobiales bacterium]